MVGHQKQWDFLKNKFESGQIPHAYLFAGPDEIGKKFLAKEFVKLINCQSTLEGPTLQKSCQKCQKCKLIENEVFPDLLIVKSANSIISIKEGTDKMEIDISQIRNAQNFLSYKSYYGPDFIEDPRLRRDSFKTVIIDNAERMNLEAQNCFLKTLEEPKGKTIIILVSSKPEMLLPTIFSRCQTIKFFTVNHFQIADYLKSQNISERKAENLAEISEGKPGKAINFLLNPEILEREKRTLQDLLEIISLELASRFQYAKKADLKEDNFNKTLEILQRYFRSLLLMKIGVNPKTSLVEVKDLTTEQVKKIIRLIENINHQATTTNVNQKLALEILLLEL